MENNQLVVSDRTDNRRSDGTFAPGNCANPNGGKGKQKWQPYGKRVTYWLEKLSASELRAMAKDKKRMGDLSLIDSICIRHILNTLAGEDIRQERKDMLDRIEGQPKQIIQEVHEEETDDAFGGIDDAANTYLNVTKSI